MYGGQRPLIHSTENNKTPKPKHTICHVRPQYACKVSEAVKKRKHGEDKCVALMHIPNARVCFSAHSQIYSRIIIFPGYFIISPFATVNQMVESTRT